VRPQMEACVAWNKHLRHQTIFKLQEREKRGEKWTPRWFKATPDAKVFDLEFTPEECPLYEFTGTALQRPPAAAASPGAHSSVLICLNHCVLHSGTHPRRVVRHLRLHCRKHNTLRGLPRFGRRTSPQVQLG